MPVRGVFAALALAVALLTPRPGAEAQPAKDLDADFRTTVRPFLDAHCGGCHGAERPKADLNLQRFTTPASIAAEFGQWEEVLSQLKSGEMPPRTAKAQPTAAQRQAVIAWLEAFRAREAERNAGDPGVVLPRRLSVAEYDATVRDLTGVDIRPARDFPVDPANAAGFDNTGESLTMSPALLAKYLQAAKFVAEHLVLNPDGFTFAPYPVIAETDRDKYHVRRIVDFYLAQPTDLAPYFFAAWQGQPDPKLSPKYQATVTALLREPAEVGPVAAVQALFRALPKDEAAARRGCDELRDVVLKVRGRTAVKVRNLSVPGMNAGAQALVLWKDREMATSRRTYGGGALTLKTDDLPAAAKAKLTPPDDDDAKKAFEASFARFCDVFPDAFYVKERARVFLGPNGEQGNAGRLLSAGFHNQMGYFRDDRPLCELILDANGKRQLDRLWDEFDFACDIPARMHSGLIWFERSESPYLSGTQFDFARAEDKDVVSPDKFGRFRDEYVKHTLKQSRDEVATQAVKDHFKISEANIRRVEAARAAAEPKHVAALQAFAEKAYRRKLTAAEKDGVAAFYRTLRGEEATHEEAVRDTVVRVLVSPHFTYRVDLPAAGKTALTDEALASRLSYFLWSSMPDAELLEHAAKGTLHTPDVLTAQVRRMLKDDRARGLAANFGGSWLDFRRFEEHNAVDRGRFPQFTNDLRAAMAEEPVRFLLDVMQTDRPVTDVLSGKHTFVNAPLAKHYGMPTVTGWTRIDDADKYGRGGVLPMGVFLTKNAPGLRTSPVKRGYWVVTKLLGERIPPPPPDVPELPADEGKLGTLTVREALAKHREHPSCAGCHARFDSFGLAFEGFGPVGEKRSKDLAGNPVDTRVSFPGNAEGEGVGGLRDYLKDRRQAAFVDTLCRKLLAYGLGRTLLLTDEPTVAAMKARLARDGGRFAGLAEVIATSPQFLNKRPQ
ncbi:MAG: DUF1592 domain-containing protein [Gemmataceae bacterium]